MRLLLTLLVLTLSSCATETSRIKVAGHYQNGTCIEYKTESPLRIIRLFRNLEEFVETTSKDKFSKGIEQKLKQSQLESNGMYAEISTTEGTWKSLYGAWGYGVVVGNCIVKFEPILVS